MLMAFQIILMIVLLVSVTGVVGERQDMKLREHLVYICNTSMLLFIVTVIWL